MTDADAFILAGVRTLGALATAAALDALVTAKARGWDWTLHTSWCSDLQVFILRLRAPGQHAHAARTKVGTFSEVLAWAYGEVGRSVTVDASPGRA